MADAVLSVARDAALACGGASAAYVPVSGSGPLALLAIVRPLRGEVADFPELRDVLGAERPGWAMAVSQDDVAGRPRVGDRLTFDAPGTIQVRAVRSDPHGLWWLLSGFLVEDESAALEPGIYMPIGLGFSMAGSLL